MRIAIPLPSVSCDTMLCQSCGALQAMYVVERDGGRVALCVDCNLKDEHAQTLAFNRLVSEHNRANASLRSNLGLPPARPMQQVPLPPVSVGTKNVTFHNVHVEGSVYGVINTGRIKTVDLSISALDNAGEREAARAFQSLTEAIAKSTELNERTRSELFERLSFVAEEATKPRSERRAHVALDNADKIGSTLGGVLALVELWKRFEPAIRALFPG